MAPIPAGRPWPDEFDIATMSFFVLLVLVLCTLGYVFMVIDYRAYLRSLRRHLVRLVYRWDLPEWAMAQTPRCLQALGLRLPCTEEEVLRAYREQVKKLHPDRGGDKRRFLRVQSYFEEALEVVRKHEAGRQDAA